jgi:DNA-binding NarL/FixJ family response regulator
MAEARKKILCIEGDSATAQLIVEEFGERGFDVVVACNGQEGFVTILKGIPDLVLCDVGAPGMSGFDLLELLIAFAPRLERLPRFVLVTATPDRDSELRARRLGVDDYVIKPIDFDILELIIRARLANIATTEIRPKLAVNLNERELETLTWAARGNTSLQIAEKLGVPRRTVDFHLDNARNKLSAANRIDAVIKAALGGLIEP